MIIAGGPDPDAHAALLCDWCIEPRAGDQVLVGLTPQCLPLVEALYRAILDRGAWPLVRLHPSVLADQFYAHAQPHHLDGFPALELIEVEQADALIGIDAPGNTRRLAGIDPGLISRAGRARRPVQETRLATTRWCGTLWPTSALAQQAGMSDGDYAAFVRRALFLDRPDPAAAWQELSAHQHGIVELLGDVEEIHIEADGTDLHLRVGGRRWVNSDGRRNMPSGEVFTGPLEDSANGVIRFSVRANPGGEMVEDLELRFVDGEVVRARAARGQDYVEAALSTDRGARFLGELGIGTNPGIDRATGSVLLDEKIAGTVHLALGRSYPETGGTNASALHWDLVCDLRGGGRISGDGQMLNDRLWSVV